MTSLGDSSHGSFVLADARIAVLGYDADARDYALALARAGNHLTVGLEHAGASWNRARQDGFAVAGASAAVDGAAVVVVVVRDHVPLWRSSRSHVAPGALVVVSSAFALESGVFDDGAADVALVIGYHDGRSARARIAVHRDVTGRALLRAIGYAHAAFGRDAVIDATSVTAEVDRELAAVAERVGTVLAFAASSDADGAPEEPPASSARIEPEPQPRSSSVDDREPVSVNEILGPARGLA